MVMRRCVGLAWFSALLLYFAVAWGAAEDRVRDLETAAVSTGSATWAHWGTTPSRYSDWGSHSNRLVPVYTFGLNLRSVTGGNSVYRDAERLQALYGRLPEGTLNPRAEYMDQTDVFRLQEEAARAGKRYIVLFVFDGMDWDTTRAAAIYRAGKVTYRDGRGTGLAIQDYRGVETDFGFAVTSPHNDGTKVDVDAQTVINPGGTTPGGYDAHRGGATPWNPPADLRYLIGKSREQPHAVTDSAAAATSLCAGIKTYNDAINIDPEGKQVETIAHRLQSHGYAIGVITSVPISHATPACAYAHNVHRDDYQDITRDLIGLPSVSHREHPLPGVDVLLGAGWGVSADNDPSQGMNFVPGNRYIADSDLEKVDAARGGQYVVVQRTAGAAGPKVLREAATAAALKKQRLLGLFGTSAGHLPFQTADGHFDPTISVRLKGDEITPLPAEQYTSDDLNENPTLADLTRAGLDVLSARSDRFWLMIEAGDVDWANHANNIDNSIGAVISGDDAFRALTEWIETHNAWDETAVIVTSDHGHYLFLDHPEVLVEKAATDSTQ